MSSARFVALGLFLVAILGCDAKVDFGSSPAPIVQAAPVSQFGHLSPIQLPKGEWFDGWQVAAGSFSSGTGSQREPDRYLFATTTIRARARYEAGVHTLRNAQGVPVLIVKDPGQ